MFILLILCFLQEMEADQKHASGTRVSVGMPGWPGPSRARERLQRDRLRRPVGCVRFLRLALSSSPVPPHYLCVSARARMR